MKVKTITVKGKKWRVIVAQTLGGPRVATLNGTIYVANTGSNRLNDLVALAAAQD